MTEKLKWLLSRLQKLHDDGHIRYEGDSVFFEARAELQHMVDTYVEPPPPLPQVVNQVFAPGELVTMATTIGEAAAASVRAALAPELEASDLTVLSAIAESRADVLAALAPAEA